MEKVLIPVLNKNFRKHVEAVENLILSEVNTKSIEYIDDTSNLLSKKIKPNFRKLGKEYGAGMKEITIALSSLQSKQIADLESLGKIQLDLSIGKVDITLEDVEIISEDIPGWSVASDGKLTVALDINITEELKMEGLSRELVNRIQNLRKDKGLQVQDKIAIQIESQSGAIEDTIEKFGKYIMGETQALSMRKIKNLNSMYRFKNYHLR